MWQVDNRGYGRSTLEEINIGAFYREHVRNVRFITDPNHQIQSTIRIVPERPNYFDPRASNKKTTDKLLSIRSNADGDMAPMPANWAAEHPLRDPQRRALKWMIDREETEFPFSAEFRNYAARDPNSAGKSDYGFLEIETHAKYHHRGGLLGDKVGAGKTATTIALIASRLNQAPKDLPKITDGRDNMRHKVKATLIYCPPHLQQQWQREFDKFIPNCSRRLKILN